MKKRRPAAPKVKDICFADYQTKHDSCPHAAQSFYADPDQRKHPRRVSYMRTATPRYEPPEIPRLFIQGLLGGSIKVDFRGLNVELSGAAFGHWVADESLKSLNIHRGDIALIDPMARVFRAGNLVLMELNGKATLRCLTKTRGVWFAENPGGESSERLPIVDQPLQGVAMGVIRLFTRVKAVNYRGTEANFRTFHEHSGVVRKNGGKVRALASPTAQQNSRYQKKKRPSFVFTEKPSSPRLSEIEKKPVYPGRATTR